MDEIFATCMLFFGMIRLRISSACSGTWLVMDGEVLPYERVFAELHPGLCSIMVAA